MPLPSTSSKGAEDSFPKPVSPYDCDEMDAHTDGYVEFVLEQLEGS